MKYNYKFNIEPNSEVIEAQKLGEDVGISFNDSIKAIDKKSRKKSYAENTRGRFRCPVIVIFQMFEMIDIASFSFFIEFRPYKQLRIFN